MCDIVCPKTDFDPEKSSAFRIFFPYSTQRNLLQLTIKLLTHLRFSTIKYVLHIYKVYSLTKFKTNTVCAEIPACLLRSCGYMDHGIINLYCTWTN